MPTCIVDGCDYKAESLEELLEHGSNKHPEVTEKLKNLILSKRY